MVWSVLPQQTLNRVRKWFDNIPFYGLNTTDSNVDDGRWWHCFATTDNTMVQMEFHKMIFVYLRAYLYVDNDDKHTL